jgi:hypothetical protein
MSGRKPTTAVAGVRALRSSLPKSHEWTERDLAVLLLAERQAADIDRLEKDIAANGVRVSGRGADVLNQALGEVRQGRIALGRLLGLVDIPGEASTGAQHGCKAAQARWQAAS